MSSPFFPFLVINIGVLSLAVNLGYVPSSAFSQLLNWWPLVLVFIGLEMIFEKRKFLSFLIGLISIMVFWSIVFSDRGILLPNQESQTKAETWYLSPEATQSAELVDINLRLPRGGFDLSPGEQIDLLNLNSRIPNNSSMNISEGTETDQLSYSFGFDTPRWISGGDWQTSLRYSDQAPLNRFHLDLGWGDSSLDLTQANLNSLQLKQGIGPVKLVIDDQTQYQEIDLDLGIGGVVVKLSAEPETQIRYQVGIGSVIMDDQALGQGFGVRGETGSGNQTINIKLGIGKLEIISNAD